MDYLIQNTSPAPIHLTLTEMKNGKPELLARIIFEGDNQITKIPERVYNEMLKNAFYRQKMENGILIPLNSQREIDAGMKASVQTKEVAYSKFVSLVGQIEATGGLTNDTLRPYLDGEGIPNLLLCKKNLGDQLNAEDVEQFRSRYLIEKSNGLHNKILILPNGGKMPAGAGAVEVKKDVETEDAEDAEDAEDLSTVSLEVLKQKAEDLNVTFNEEISFERLLKKVKNALKKRQE